MKYLAIAALVALGACSPPATATGYPAGADLTFQQSCQASARRAAGQSAEQSAIVGYCSCVWGRIVAEIPYSEFQAYEQMSPGERPSSATQQKFVEYAASCAPQTPPNP